VYRHSTKNARHYRRFIPPRRRRAEGRQLLNMEIVAHGLWAVAAATVANRKTPARIRARWFAAWAMFPDVFAFAPEVAVALSYRLFASGPQAHGHHLLGIELYDPSHSLVVFAAVFVAAWVLLGHPIWTMLGWALHVAMDIPTHSSHYPTPFLWPLSDYSIAGVSWRDPGVLALTYAALAVVFLVLWLDRRRAPRESVPQEFAEKSSAGPG